MGIYIYTHSTWLQYANAASSVWPSACFCSLIALTSCCFNVSFLSTISLAYDAKRQRWELTKQVFRHPSEAPTNCVYASIHQLTKYMQVAQLQASTASHKAACACSATRDSRFRVCSRRLAIARWLSLQWVWVCNGRRKLSTPWLLSFPWTSSRCCLAQSVCCIYRGGIETKDKGRVAPDKSRSTIFSLLRLETAINVNQKIPKIGLERCLHHQFLILLCVSYIHQTVCLAGLAAVDTCVGNSLAAL